MCGSLVASHVRVVHRHAASWVMDASVQAKSQHSSNHPLTDVFVARHCMVSCKVEQGKHSAYRESRFQTGVASSLLDRAGCMQAVLPSSSFRGGRHLLQDDSQALDRLSKEELIAQLNRLQQQQGAAASQQGSSGSQQGAVQQPGTSAGGQVDQSRGQQGAAPAAAGATTAVPASSIAATSADLISVPVPEPIIQGDATAGALPGLGATAAAEETAAVMKPSGSQQGTSSEQPPGQGELQRLLQRRRKQREQVLALVQNQVRPPFSCTNAFQTQQSLLLWNQVQLDNSLVHYCRLCCTAMPYDTEIIQNLCLPSTVSPQAAADRDTNGLSLQQSCHCDRCSCLAASPGDVHQRSRGC